MKENLVIGGIVTYAIKVEKLIDKFLANYFCQDDIKREQFLTMILFNERITFDFKKELISILVKNQYVDVLKEYPDFLKKLSSIPEHRNRFAHLDIVFGLDRIMLVNMKKIVWDGSNLEKELKTIDQDTIIFARYKNGVVRYIGYGLEQITSIENDLVYIVKGFSLLERTKKKQGTDLPAE